MRCVVFVTKRIEFSFPRWVLGRCHRDEDDDGKRWVLLREYTLTNPLFSLNYELFDVTVQKPLVEIASYGIVDESLLPFRLVPRLVSKDGVVVPSSL